MNNLMAKVAVLNGGYSAERDISLASGKAIYSALIKKGVNAVAIDVDDNIAMLLSKGNFTSAFVIMHGRGGEDGTIQGLLEWLQIPYTGSGVLASSLAMDKFKTKLIWQSLNLATPKSILLHHKSDFKQVLNNLGGKVMVKPNREGSSLGLTCAYDAQTLADAFKTAHKLDDTVFAEQWIAGDEYTVGIINGKALPIIKIETKADFYDFDAKYNSTNTKYIIPSGLDNEATTKMQNLAMKAYEAIGCSGWGRVDFLMGSNNEPLLIEINTIPGMTSHSLIPKAAKALGIEFDDLVLDILNGAKTYRSEP